jgi:DNA adenine methylase
MVLVTEVTAMALRSPISRVGGKSRLAKRIIELFPEHNVYVEVFFGAGWIFFKKDPVKIEVVNDIDGELVNFFRVLRFHPEEFERQLSYFLHSRQMFEEGALEPRLTDIQRAVTWYYRNRTSYGAMGEHFNYFKKSTRGAVPLLTRDFKEISERMGRVTIENADFEKILTRYDSDEVFFYLDPPYTGLTNPYPYDWSADDERRLWANLARLQGRWLASWGGTFPNELKPYHVVELPTTYQLVNEKRVVEWAIMNY